MIAPYVNPLVAREPDLPRGAVSEGGPAHRWSPIVPELECEGADPHTPVGDCRSPADVEVLVEDEEGNHEWVPMCDRHAALMGDV